MTDRPIRREAIVVALGLVAAALAVGTHLWQVVPWPRFGFATELALLALAIAWCVHRLRGWSMASCLALVWCMALAWFVGIPAIAATGLLAIAALCIGLALVPAMPGRIAVALPAGLLAIAGTAGWIVMLPVHYPAIWALLLAAVLGLRYNSLVPCLRELRHSWRRSVTAAPRWAAFAMTLLGVTSTACWLPTMQADDLTYHLGLPSQLVAYHRYIPDPTHQVWAFAAWAGDILHAIATLLAGGPARGALNAVWLCTGAAATWTLAQRFEASFKERWVAVALFASFPPMAWLAAGMQTELAATAALLALAATLLTVSPTEGLESRRAVPLWIPAAVLFGGLLALKPLHALVAMPLLAWAAWRYRGRWSGRPLLMALGIVIAVGGSSYCFAWWKTGNPVLPLFNATFQSPYFPAQDFDDRRWHAGLSPTVLWNLVVDTHRYGEVWDGGLGLGLLALAGAWLLAVGRRTTRTIALVAGLAMLLPLLPLQYARYVVPGMAVWLVASLPGTERALGVRLFGPVMAAVCVVNLALQANAGWTQHSAPLKRLIRTGDARAVLADYAPERLLLATIPNDGSIVLATDPERGFIAELAGRGRTVSWHDPALAVARDVADAGGSGDRWRALFVKAHARWMLLVPAEASPALRQALTDANALRAQRIGDAELWFLPP